MGEVNTAANRIVITGATGYVGRATVECARSQGIEVVATYRRDPLDIWADDPGIIPCRIDLTNTDSVQELARACDGADAVVHAAAHLGDDPIRLENDTIRSTQNLLDALSGNRATLVLVSSIAVYDTMKISKGATVTEASPLIDTATAGLGYASAKRQQEVLCERSGRDCWQMRAGAVYGRGQTWHALMGFWLSKLHVQINSSGELPLIHIDHLANALVRAAAIPSKGVQPVNLLDDDLPTRERFLRAHRTYFGWPKLTFRVPYPMWLLTVRLLKPFSLRLPGLLRETDMRARLMPLNYSNLYMHNVLGMPNGPEFETLLATAAETTT